VLWVRAGQVQEWQSSAVVASHTLKAIDYADVAATIVLFQPTRLDERARALSGSVQPRSLWSRAAVHASPARRRLDDLIETAARSLPPSMQEELLARMLGMLVVELALADPVENAAHGTSEDLFSALTAAIDANFASTRNTGDYARQLGYSARTINRSALRNTGLTVKQLVDQRALLEAKRLPTGWIVGLSWIGMRGCHTTRVPDSSDDSKICRAMTWSKSDDRPGSTGQRRLSWIGMRHR